MKIFSRLWTDAKVPDRKPRLRNIDWMALPLDDGSQVELRFDPPVSIYQAMTALYRERDARQRPL